MTISTKLKLLSGRRVRVTTVSGKVHVGWCRGLCARDTRLVLDRVTYKSLVPVQGIVDIAY